MRPKGSFLSLRIDPGRLALAGIWAALGLLAALTLLYVEADVRWAAPVMLALAVYGWLRWRARRRPMPDLAPDQAVFRVSLPSAWPLASDYLVIVLFCLGGCVFGAVTAARFGGIEGKDSFSGWGLVFLAFCAGLLLFCGAGAGYYLVRMSQLAVFSLTARGDGALTAGLPHRAVHLRLTELRARRILAPGGSDLYALVIAPKQGPEVWIPAFPRNPDQRRFLEQLCAWFEARGVPVSTQQRLIPSSQLLFLWEIVVYAALTIVCIFGAPAIVAPVSFWVQWLLSGTADIFVLLSYYMAALLLGMVLGLDGMGTWMRELFTGALFRRPLGPDERFPVLIMEESLSAEIFGMDARRGSLRVEGNALVVETRKGRWRIEPSRVVGIQRAGLDATVQMMSQERFLLRPIKILWEGEDGCLRGLYVASRGGWTVRRNLRLDRQLFQMLETWRRDGGVPGLAQVSLGPRRLGPAMAALFLLLAITAIPVHNRLISDYIRTGKLHPPPWVKPGDYLLPDASLLSVEAVRPGPFLCMEMVHGSVLEMRWWIVARVGGEARPCPPGPLLVPSQPGDVTHVLQTQYATLELMMLPSGKRRGNQWPPQIISMETGQTRDLLSFPEKGRRDSSAALYKDEKVFYSYRAEDRSGAPVEIGWVDVPKDQYHSLGQIRVPDLGTSTYPGCSTPPPAFFPGGRQVLYSWSVIDLETGENRPVARPAALEPEGLSFWRSDVFSAGNRLRLRVRPPSRVTSSTLESAMYLRTPSSAVQTTRTTTLVCEIDPVSAKAEVIDSLPTSVTLLSADGNRWLVHEPVPGSRQPARVGGESAPPAGEATSSSSELALVRIAPAPRIPKEYVLKLYDHDTRTSNTLFVAPGGTYYRLVAGRAELLVWSAENGLSTKSIEMK